MKWQESNEHVTPVSIWLSGCPRNATNTGCLSRDVFEDAMAEAKARSFQIKATYVYEILQD